MSHQGTGAKKGKAASLQRTRRRILLAASEALAVDPAASMADVAETAEVGRATLYRHFATRESLVRELALQAMQEMNAAIEGLAWRGSHRRTFEELFDAILPLGDRYRFLINRNNVCEDEEVDALYRRQSQAMERLVAKAQRDGELDASLPAAWIMQIVDALIWATWTAVADGDLAPNEATARVMQTLWSGVGVKPARKVGTKSKGARKK